jgi:hypothetical protein
VVVLVCTEAVTVVGGGVVFIGVCVVGFVETVVWTGDEEVATVVKVEFVDKLLAEIQSR